MIPDAVTGDNGEGPGTRQQDDRRGGGGEAETDEPPEHLSSRRTTLDSAATTAEPISAKSISASPRNATTASRCTVAWAPPSIVSQTVRVFGRLLCGEYERNGREHHMSPRRTSLQLRSGSDAKQDPREREARGR